MLKKKVNGKKGFTLAELLIVVAIVGILVAISMPILTKKLDKAQEATDAANLRAAKAVAVVAALDVDSEFKKDGTTPYYYDIEKGILVGADDKPGNYGKYKNHTVIKVILKSDGTADVEWDQTTTP